jgi:hypothetical protein
MWRLIYEKINWKKLKLKSLRIKLKLRRKKIQKETKINVLKNLIR